MTQEAQQDTSPFMDLENACSAPEKLKLPKYERTNCLLAAGLS
jgi:hypothetical protein